MDKKKHNIWFPYADMKTIEPPLSINRAQGVTLETEGGQSLIDGLASWWCVIHGYNHPELNRAAKDQLDQFSHIMLGGLIHGPVEALAQKLIDLTPASLNHVFFSDSGSVGVEVALKMAIQYWRNKRWPRKTKFIGLRKGYHGDTTGAMSISDPDEGMHALFSAMLPPHYFIDPPVGKNFDSCLAQLEYLLAAHRSEIAGIILEPLLQAAGGFNMYAPSCIIKIKELCIRNGVLLIVDEVATGFGRTGSLFAIEQAQVEPDIMILGKGLTGGYVGMAATLASSEIFYSFFNNPPLMHGPTFMGNALACAIALKSIEIFEKESYLLYVKRIESQLKQSLLGFTHPRIAATRVLGATGVIEVKSDADLEGFQAFAIKRGVWLRPFDKYLYTMPAYIIKENELDLILSTMKAWFTGE